MRPFRGGLLLVSAVILTPSLSAQDLTPTYWKDIRPLFRKHCTVCHRERNLDEPDISGGLALESPEAIKKSAKVHILKPGKSADSGIYLRLVSTSKRRRMPLDADPLSKEKIDLIKRWIDTGAKEGKKPDSFDTPVVVKRKVKRRKLDIILKTTSTVPKGELVKRPGPLELRLKVGPLSPVTAVAFSPDRKFLAAGTYGQVTVWDLEKAKPAKVLTNVLGAVNDIRFSGDGKTMAVAGGQPSAKGDLRIYQTSDWSLKTVFRGHDDVVFAISFSPDFKRLASASFDKTVRVWDLTAEKEAIAFKGHSDFVYDVAFSPDGKFLASASKDRTSRLIDLNTGDSKFTFSGMNEDVLTVAFSGDGKKVVTSGFEARLHWWDPQTGKREKLTSGHSVATNEVVFSKDGSKLVSAGSDKMVRTWTASGGSKIGISVGSVAYAVAISDDNELIAAGSFDGLVRVWIAKSGHPLVTLLALPPEGDKFEWLALTPTGFAQSSQGLIDIGRWRTPYEIIDSKKAWARLINPEIVVAASQGKRPRAPSLSK